MSRSSSRRELVTKWALHCVEEVSIGRLSIIFILVVLLFAAVYIVLTPFGHGIGHNFLPVTKDRLYNGIYMSLITVSSLGYGDIHPIGASKAIASIEVFVGILFTGVFVARLASRRLSYHVSRLFSEHTERNIRRIKSEFLNLHERVLNLLNRFSAVIQEIPNRDTIPDRRRDVKEFASEFRKTVESLYSASSGLNEFITTDTVQGEVFKATPVNAFRGIGDEVNNTMFGLTQVLISMSISVRASVLSASVRRRMSQAVALQVQICRVMRRNLEDQQTLDTFKQIQVLCQDISGNVLLVPEVPLPDQTFHSGDDPELVDGDESVSVGV